MSKSGPEGKSFQIPKQLVWEAYRRVKAKKGAAGVDGQSIADFEEDLRNNLYKIWNRMSSGTYFPPPVKAVEIPKPHGGGTRILGVPTVADRIAQTVVALRLEARTEYGAGGRTGFWILISGSSLTLWIMIWSSRRWRPTLPINGFCCMSGGG